MADRGRQYLLLADEDLISLLEGGDPRAFGALYDRHSRAAYSLAYRMLQEMIGHAIDSGIVVVAAAGNSGTDTPHYPAAGNHGVTLEDPLFPPSVDGLLAVTSVDKYEKKSDFANYGLWVDIVAPGEEIRSAFPVDEYANWSGTSMATPFVSGQAALIRKVHDSLGPADVKKKIRDTARKEIYSKNTDYLGQLGAGHADVCESLSG